MNENLRIAILGDATGIHDSLDSVVGMAQDTVGKVGSEFKRLSGIIIGSLGVAGIAYSLEQGMTLAGQQQSLHCG